jgi:hypothetical protein
VLPEEAQRQLADLHTALRHGDTSITDHDLCSAVAQLDEALAWRVNAESAAVYLFAAIAPICRQRPHLTDDLLPYAFQALMEYAYDDAAGVVAWIGQNLETLSRFGSLTPEDIAWMQGLMHQPAPIQHLLDRLNQDLEQAAIAQMLDDFAPHSAIPRERIHVRLEWNDRLLQKAAGCLLFFTSVPKETLLSFRVLTQVLAATDPTGKLPLLVLDVHPWLRPAQFRHPEMQARWFYCGTEEPQTFWVYHGQVLTSVGMGIIDYHAFEQPTQELMHRLAQEGSE